MEAYIIIISAAITAIAIAYKIAKSLKENANNFKIFPMVIAEGNYVLSFPVVTPNESSVDGAIDPVNAIKVYFVIKEIEIADIDEFAKMANVINWYDIISDIINDTQLSLLDYSFMDNVNLSSPIVVKCSIESAPPIEAHIQINTNLIIKINKQ